MSNMLCIFIIGVGAIVAVFMGINEREGFVNVPGNPGVRCGVDLPTCAVGTQCMNGFCVNSKMPKLTSNQLPVYP
jgi:hypothetical protein